MKFTKSDVNNGSYINGDGVHSLWIEDNEFIADAVTVDGGSIILANCEHCRIENNHIQVPSILNGFGIRLEEGKRNTIINNFISLEFRIGNGITVDAAVASYSNYIAGNTIFNYGLAGAGISVGGNTDKEDISYNVIRLSGDNSVGIICAIPPGYGDDIAITNNTIIYEANDTDAVGVSVPYFGLNSAATYEIVNNIFYFEPTTGILQDSKCLSVNLDIGYENIVDYNLFYNVQSTQQFFWDGNPDTISAHGDRQYDFDPKMDYYLVQGTSVEEFYPFSATDSYNVTATSQCLGLGRHHEHIGLFGGNYTGSDRWYNTIVDTVTHQMGAVYFETIPIDFTFFNCTFTESIDTVNNSYRKNYTTTDVYENQFQWLTTATDDFPFTLGNHLYDEPLLYVIMNKGDLAPFDNITCPANPGYNFSAYIGYETGLFGNDRATYINTCNTSDTEYRFVPYDIYSPVLENTVSATFEFDFTNPYSVPITIDNVRVENFDASYFGIVDVLDYTIAAYDTTTVSAKAEFSSVLGGIPKNIKTNLIADVIDGPFPGYVIGIMYSTIWE